MHEHRPQIIARRPPGLFIVTVLLLAAPSPPALAGRPHVDKAACKKIQQAVRKGHTLEQITTELQVDAQQVMTCTQAKGKRRKQKATKIKRAGSPTTRQQRTAAAGTSATQPAYPEGDERAASLLSFQPVQR